MWLVKNFIYMFIFPPNSADLNIPQSIMFIQCKIVTTLRILGEQKLEYAQILC